MPSILRGLDMVQQSLAAQQYALSLTQKNIANANNPAYTRQVAVFTTGIVDGLDQPIPGVYTQAERNQFLDYGVNRETQSLGKFDVTSEALQQLDNLLNENSGLNLEQAISNFFGSFTQLSSNPTDITLRQQVLSAATALSTVFHGVYGGIARVQAAQDKTVANTVDEVNTLTASIADLNKKVQFAQATKSDEVFTLRDNRAKALEELSALVDISYYENDRGAVTVTTHEGGLLVLEDEHHTLTAAPVAPNALMGVMLDGVDITNSLQSGKLGGLIDVRDNKIAGYLASLDDMAAAIISSVNEQHAQGSDLDGAAGVDFFAPFVQSVPGSNAGAADSMAVAITDERQIAAAAAGGASGNNTNAELLAGIADEDLFSDSTIVEFYASLIYRVGSDEKTAEDGVQTQNDTLEGMKNLRDSLSGVNMDEEAANIIKFQKAYEATAKYAKVIDTLSDVVLGMLGN
jgi:flagellar hook-associated protein 1